MFFPPFCVSPGSVQLWAACFYQNGGPLHPAIARRLRQRPITSSNRPPAAPAAHYIQRKRPLRSEEAAAAFLNVPAYGI
ncbi:hypothetical protein CLOSTASPAR_04949 [[Clostridium] asparagiforme DSM 15981]|uniref:Uncharacterized protein n=1 Tax=[Clostridium] asparagiforme DSM 15981 TaxID=518636 RepID=C0D6Q1_9FIRM|nr:hypothetical protein CLOSTASPAR_04949 [[Clostridium] asparagiforme DSM 15981]